MTPYGTGANKSPDTGSSLLVAGFVLIAVGVITAIALATHNVRQFLKPLGELNATNTDNYGG